MCAARAIDLRAPLEPAPATAVVLRLLRRDVDGTGPDRYVAPELAAAESLLRTGEPDAKLRDAGITVD